MGSSLKWTGVALAVLAGVLLGFAFSTFAYRHRILRVPGRHAFVARLAEDLHLTPNQLHQVEGLMRDTHAKLEQQREDSRRQRMQIIMQTHDQIRALLTPEQQEKFDRDFAHPPTGEGHGGRELRDD